MRSRDFLACVVLQSRGPHFVAVKGTPRLCAAPPVLSWWCSSHVGGRSSWPIVYARRCRLAVVGATVSVTYEYIRVAVEVERALVEQCSPPRL